MAEEPGIGPDRAPSMEIDTRVPHSARIWNYWLGGKDNYQVDRDAGDAWVAVNPEITVIARETRAFINRSVRFLAAEAGIRQFLDIGTGLPTADNTHQVAQQYSPDARIVYVDNDPLVLAHARALLTSSREGATRYLHADMRETSAILGGAAELLDFRQPVAVLFMAVLGHVADTAAANGVVRTIMDRLAPGSYLAICDSAHHAEDTASQQAKRAYADTGASPYHNRSQEELHSLFAGLDLVDPGFVSAPLCRPAQPTEQPRIGNHSPAAIDLYAGVARKP